MTNYRNGYVNLQGSEVVCYLRLKEQFVRFLLDNDYRLWVDFEEERADVHDSEGNDLAHMTFKQLSRRTTIR